MRDDGEERAQRPAVQGAAAVTKGLRLLQVISELGDEATIRHIQQHAGLPRPTVYRLLNTLEQEGFVERNPIGGEYVLGRQLVRLAQHSQAQGNLQGQVRATLQAIGKATGETVHLAVPYGCHMTFIDKVESPEAVRMASYIGMPIPMHSTSVGKAYLAALDSDICEQYLSQIRFDAVTPQTITGPTAFRDELALTRARGYARDDEENEAGIVCFGHAVHASDGALAGAISVSVPHYRLSEERQSRIIETLDRLCRQGGLGSG